MSYLELAGLLNEIRLLDEVKSRRRSRVNHRRLSENSQLELSIAIAPADPVTAVDVPSFQNTVANQRRTTEVNELAPAFDLARNEAIKRVRYVSVCKSADGASCGGDEIIRAHPALNDSLTLRRRGDIDGFVSFRPSGTMGTNVGNLTGTSMLCDKHGADMARGLILRPSGQWEVTHDVGHDNEATTCPEGEE